MDRTFPGLAVPWGVPVRKNGCWYCHDRGSLTWDRVQLLIWHDSSQIVGRAIELWETDEALFGRFRVANGPRGDRALALVADGIYTGLSVGLDPDTRYELRDDIYYPAAGSLLVEVSLTPTPAYDDARIEGSRRPVA